MKKQPANRDCCICGQKFSPRSSSHSYCSPQCKARGKSAANRAWMSKKKGGEIIPLADQTRPCIVCGQSFTPRGYRQIVCTNWGCRRERDRRAKAKQRAAVSCIICGHEFTREGDSTRTTCSPACRDALSSRTQSDRASKPLAQTREYGFGFHDMQTYCPEFPSWGCPEMLPFDCSEYGHYEPKKTKSHREIAA